MISLWSELLANTQRLLGVLDTLWMSREFFVTLLT